MRKLIVMSVVLIQIVLPIWASKDVNAKRGLRRTVAWFLLYLVVWVLIGSRIFIMLPNED